MGDWIALLSRCILIIVLGAATIAASPPSADMERALKSMDVFKECDICPEMVVVSAGSFLMGTAPEDVHPFAGHPQGDEGPQHWVTIAKPLAVARFDVTVDQFGAFVAETGYDAVSKCFTYEHGGVEIRPGRSWRNPGFEQSGLHPAVCLSWNDAKAYLAWLSDKTGKRYRLLSEAEWEYAARAGSTTLFSFGNDAKDLCRFGNGGDQSLKKSGWGHEKAPFAPCDDGHLYTAAVGSFLPNQFGLYDMHGNASEWVEDCYSDNYTGAKTDGSASITGDCARRVTRGGAWLTYPVQLRSAARYKQDVDGRNSIVGFRVARTLTP